MFANILDVATRPAVPIFFMISGYFFLGDASPQRRHFIRILSALVFYSALALAYRYILGYGPPIEDLPLLIVRPAFYHLWFFYAIIAVYMLMRATRVRTDRSAFVVILFTMVAFNPSVVGLPMVRVPPGFLDGNMIYYFGYACIGGCIRQVHIPRWSRGLCAAIYLAASAGIVVATARASSAAGAFDGYFYQYTNSLVIVQSVALFCAVRTTKSTWPFSRLIAELSLPIYGIHALVLDLRIGLGILNGEFSAFLAIPAAFALALLVSLAAGVLIRRADRRNLVH